MTTFMGFPVARDGYGYSTRKIADALAVLAPDWDFLDMRPVSNQEGGFVHDDALSWTVDGTALAMCAPEWLAQIHAPTRIVSTMFESTRLLPERVEAINRYAARVIVPCEWNREVFRDNGITVPIDVVGLGVDARDYPLLERKRTDKHPYTFLWSGTGDQRKGWDLVYRAFHAAGFGGRKDVRLVMHFRNMPHGIKHCDDKNVVIHKGSFPDTAVLKMLEQADCYVFPSRGEGWGLPPREAAATGLPVIATNFGGLAEGIDYWALPLRVAGMAKADFGFFECDLGEWAEPDFDHLVEQMRWCFENQKSARYFGRSASEWLHQYATWTQTAQGLMEVAARVI